MPTPRGDVGKGSRSGHCREGKGRSVVTAGRALTQPSIAGSPSRGRGSAEQRRSLGHGSTQGHSHHWRCWR